HIAQGRSAMVRKVRELKFVAVMMVGLIGTAQAPSQDLPPAPVPAVPSGPAPESTLLVPPQSPAPTPPTAYSGSSATLPPRRQSPSAVPLAQIPPSGALAGSPPNLMPPPPPEPLPAPPVTQGYWRDRPNLPPWGWFATVEVDVVGPHVKNRLFE